MGSVTCDTRPWAQRHNVTSTSISDGGPQASCPPMGGRGAKACLTYRPDRGPFFISFIFNTIGATRITFTFVLDRVSYQCGRIGLIAGTRDVSGAADSIGMTTSKRRPP